MNARRLLAAAVLISTAVGLSACTSPDESAAEFASWASAEEFVVSVDASPKSGTAGPYGLSAHLVVDGAIDAAQLESLSKAAREKADALVGSTAAVNIIVGNAWGFSVDAEGAHVATINRLRDDAAFVGATIEYEPLDYTPDYAGGVRGTVGSQAALRGANDALIAAVLDSGGQVDGVSLGSSTADGAFGILGEGTEQPVAAIQLWQEISGRVVLTAAHATLVSHSPERLEIGVGSAEDRATAEAIGARFADVTLSVAVG
jgi:hypothetical protein